jgi:hypothetical protein
VSPPLVTRWGFLFALIEKQWQLDVTDMFPHVCGTCSQFRSG